MKEVCAICGYKYGFNDETPRSFNGEQTICISHTEEVKKTIETFLDEHDDIGDNELFMLADKICFQIVRQLDDGGRD